MKYVQKNLSKHREFIIINLSRTLSIGQGDKYNKNLATWRYEDF